MVELPFEIERIRTAMHESAHAVAAILFDVKFDSVTNGVSSNYSMLSFSWDSPCHGLACMAVAGGIAERRALGKGDLRMEIMSRSDRDIVHRVAEALGRDYGAYFDEVANVTEDVMSEPGVMKATAAVAKALLEKTRLSCEETRAIVNTFIRS